MRIAYLINSLEGGGAALPVPALVEVMRGAGAEVAVLALTRRNGRALPALEAAGIETQVRPGGDRDHLAALRWLDGAVARWRPTHLFTSLTRATLLGQIVGARHRLPVTSWQHNAWLKPANLALLRLMRRRSALWVADSEAVADLTRRRLALPPERVMLWPIFRADPQARQATPWRAGEAVRMGSLGRLHPAKGYDLLADAVAGLGVAPRIGGEGGEAAALAGRGLDLVGYVERPADFLAGLHLYLQPSRREGLCVAAHEAMAAGLPVLASAVGELAHSVLHGETGWLVPPGDAPALRRAIEAALADPAQLAAMGQAGRTRLLARYGPDRFAAAGEAILARMRAF